MIIVDLPARVVPRRYRDWAVYTGDVMIGAHSFAEGRTEEEVLARYTSVPGVYAEPVEESLDKRAGART